MKNILIIVAVFAILGLFSIVVRIALSRAKSATEQQISSGVRLHEPSTHPAEWRLSAERRAQLVAALGRVGLGDRKDKVIAELGKPDREETAMGPKGVNQVPRGSRITYQFVRYEKGLTNEKWDQSVVLHFDLDNHLREITSTVPDVQGLKE